MPTVYGCETPTARKEHKCCECRGTIRVGEKYHRHHGIWAGDAETFKVCLDCEELRAECDKNEIYDYEKVYFGGVEEFVYESRDEQLLLRFLEIKKKRGVLT